MRKIISEIKANVLALYYGAEIKYSHLNKYGTWEFAIGEWDYFGNQINICYKTGGYKN